MGIARMIAHATYLSEGELGSRFGRLFQDEEDPIGRGGRFATQSYLEHHARKLARRFDANTYVTLAKAILSHDVSRDRGGIEKALARVTIPALVVAVDSDVGHDGFLVESGQLNAHMEKLLGSLD